MAHIKNIKIKKFSMNITICCHKNHPKIIARRNCLDSEYTINGKMYLKKNCCEFPRFLMSFPQKHYTKEYLLHATI